MSGTEGQGPGWLPDPTGRHELRFWDGMQWKDDVADGGMTSIDALAPPPSRQGPPMGLLVTLGVLLVALVVGIVVVATDDDSDPSATGNRTSTTEPDSTETTGEDTTTTEEDTTSSTVADDDPIVEAMSGALVSMSDDVLTDEEATCLAQRMVQEIGVERLVEAGTEVTEGAAPADIYTEDEIQIIAGAMVDCVPSDKIGELGEAFGGIEPDD